MDPNNTNPGDENGIQIQELKNQQDIPQQIHNDSTEDNELIGEQNNSQEIQLGEDSYDTQPNDVSVYIEPTPTSSSNLAFEPEANEHLDNVPGEPYYHDEEQLKVSQVDKDQMKNNLESEEKSQNNSGSVTIGTEQQYVQTTGSIVSEEYTQREDEQFESQYESENNKESTNGHGEVSGDTCEIKVEDINLEVSVNDFQEENAGDVAGMHSSETSATELTTECFNDAKESSIEIQADESTNTQVKQEVSSLAVVEKSNCSNEGPETQIVEQTKLVDKSSVSTEIVELQPDLVIHQDVTILEQDHSSEIIANETSEVATEEIQVIEEEAHDTPELEGEIIEGSPTKATRRGRRPIHDVPMHLLGHDIARPVDSVPNGRAMPKPRLGVKVPYRNLSSQIISKEELEKEILDRSRAKKEALHSLGDTKFARGLTQRLADKIAPTSDRCSKKQGKVAETTTQSIDSFAEPSQHAEQHEHKLGGSQATLENPNQKIETNKSPNAEEIIQNDDDLLAILEGEGDEMPVLAKEVQETETTEGDGNLKLLEREIALQQLQDLPHLEPRPRIFKSRQAKSAVAQPPQPSPRLRIDKTPSANLRTQSVASKAPSAAPRTPTTISKTPTAASRTVGSTSKSVQKAAADVATPKTPEKLTATSKLYQSPSPLKTPIENIDVPTPKKVYEVEPQVKVNMVLKTYSRKRKPSDAAEFETAYPKRMSMEESELIFEKPDPLALPTDVYVTKSSRVIKKKVIWDPDDEFSSRRSLPRSTESKTATSRAVKAIEKNPNNEKMLDRRAIEKNASSEKATDKKLTVEKKATVEKSVEKRASLQEKKIEIKPVEKKITPKKTSVDKAKILVQKVSSPKVSKSPNKSKRGLSEVDRLLMDEGAVKMLYELNNSDDTSPAVKRIKDYISLDKAEKDLIKKTNQLKNDLVHNTSGESAKTLRKKEGPLSGSPGSKPAFPMERKMSKDSTMSSVHTPPRSPTFPGSMLIRRRSSSSISSGDDDPDMYLPLKTAKRKSDAQRGKKSRRADESKEGTEAEARTDDSLERVGRPGQYKSFTVKKCGKHISIDVHYIDERCFLDTKVLEELTSVLKKYGKDKECTVVSLVSSSTAFCLGLDYATLVSDDDLTKTCRATDLASKVREFLLCLLNFPKVLVAGIQGECVGLGVTMLPLFDMVIASDTATFSTPYASLGCQGEAAFFLNYPNFTNNGLTAELLYAGTTLTADEAVRRGLISKLCWPEKYKDTLKSILSSISQGSNQGLEATKKQLRGNLFKEAEAAIKAETNILIEQWMSLECQESFSKL